MAKVKGVLALLLAAGGNMSPATGDETQLGLLIALMAVCLAGIIVLLVLMKKRRKDD